MSVYTVVERAALDRFLAAFDVGTLCEYAGITAGIENTNYFVTTTTGRYVLTLFEFTPADELPFFLSLMAHLAERGIASAHPVATRDGCYLGELHQRPAALVARLPGASVSRPDRGHCAAIGRAMAHMHLASLDFSLSRVSDRGAAWRATVATLVAARLAPDDRLLLEQSVAEFRDDPLAGLPAGVIHADLFRDNVLFEQHRLTGIIDFYYAHSGAFIYDVAVAVADWCFDDARGPDVKRAHALVTAYAKVRPLAAAERAAWAQSVRAAGLRFWLSRLKDQLYPRNGVLTQIKDPAPFRQVLRWGREYPAQLAAIWA